MEMNRILMVVMLVVPVTMVTSLSVLPGSNPRLPPSDLLKDLLRQKIPPGPITVRPPPHLILPPPRYCTCQIRCCKHLLEQRRAVSSEKLSGLVNNPLVRHKRCCGCHPCHLYRS